MNEILQIFWQSKSSHMKNDSILVFKLNALHPFYCKSKQFLIFSQIEWPLCILLLSVHNSNTQSNKTLPDRTTNFVDILTNTNGSWFHPSGPLPPPPGRVCCDRKQDQFNLGLASTDLVVVLAVVVVCAGRYLWWSLQGSQIAITTKSFNH